MSDFPEMFTSSITHVPAARLVVMSPQNRKNVTPEDIQRLVDNNLIPLFIHGKVRIVNDNVCPNCEDLCVDCGRALDDCLCGDDEEPDDEEPDDEPDTLSKALYKKTKDTLGL